MRKLVVKPAIAGCALLGIAAILTSTRSSQAAATTGMTAPYLSTANSPLVISSAGYKVETFEPTSPTLATLGVTLTTLHTNSIDPGLSVDADDGVIDGSGAAGHSLTVETQANTTGATFTFNSGIIGSFPKSAAVAVTAFGGNQLVLTVFDPSNAVSGTFTIPSVFTSSPTSDDFLLWASDPAGIGAIELSSNQAAGFLHLDHLQYDTLNTISVPEPGTFACIIAAAGLLIGRRPPKVKSPL